MTDNHNAAIEAALTAFAKSFKARRGNHTIGDMRRDVVLAVAAFLRVWRPSPTVIGAGPGAAEYSTEARFYARATADELDPP